MVHITKKLTLDSFPDCPGVYLFKDIHEDILYVGKAKSLRNRIQSYFAKTIDDWKVQSLLKKYTDIEYIITKTEHDALLLEAQLIQQQKPPFNVLLKEGQPFIYILFGKQPLPNISIERNRKKSGTYFGPFLQKKDARAAYQFIMKTFQLMLCNKKIDNGCLNFHLGQCAGICRPDFDVKYYRFRIDLAKDVLRKDKQSFIKKLREKVQHYNESLAFEKARNINRYIDSLQSIFHTINAHFNNTKYESGVFAALESNPYTKHVPKNINQQLQQYLKMQHPIQTIDCFDVSHFQGKQIVGSCIRFSNGKPDKNNFRRFIIRSIDQQDDYAALQEIIQRRYKTTDNIPDLILIDGGKGQLSAAKKVSPPTVCASLAKREEILYSDMFPNGQKLTLQHDVGRLLIALRDYAHHFAIHFHRLKRNKESIYSKRPE